jgi:hypothetical protein
VTRKRTPKLEPATGRLSTEAGESASPAGAEDGTSGRFPPVVIVDVNVVGDGDVNGFEDPKE